MKEFQNDLASYYFHQGTSTRAYEYLGVTRELDEENYVYTFRVWAPNARSVALASDFSGWDTPIPMKKITDGGVYELVYTANASLEGNAYKFVITAKNGSVYYKGDPYARFSRGKDDGASIICTTSDFTFTDSEWMKHRRKAVLGHGDTYLASPMNIYEVHAASFLRHENGDYYTWRELANTLVPYAKRMGYTHIELLPIAEFPYDGSWGYQVCAFYAPTSRFGTPDDLRYFVNACHTAGVGVIVDWVPAHFPKDAWGLYEFDGEPLYEYQGRDRMESSSWGTRFFDLGREEIQSFLVSNALYFLREFHIDGLRVDAVASMLYLDYDRKPGEWFPNAKGGRENLEAIAFMQKLNSAVLGEFPDCLMIAEESTAYPGVTAPVSAGGLGFSMKWNMGFANDFYAYLSNDPIYRKYHHTALNFPIMYAFSENYVLPISHDEVVHGKHSFIDKMYGAYEDKFRQARAALLLLMTYPGKKMLFMGTEFGQFREWDYESELEWFMLDYPKHKAFRDYTAALNHFYLASPELWELDFSPEGFQWLLADENEKNAVAYQRRSISGEVLNVVVSFSGASQTLILPCAPTKEIEILFETEPSSVIDKRVVDDGEKKSVALTLSSFSGVVYREIPKGRVVTVSQDPIEQIQKR